MIRWILNLFWRPKVIEEDGDDYPYRSKAQMDPEIKSKKVKKKVEYRGGYDVTVIVFAFTLMVFGCGFLIYSYNKGEEQQYVQCINAHTSCIEKGISKQQCSQALLYCNPNTSDNNKLLLQCVGAYETCVREGVEEQKCSRTLVYCTPDTSDDNYCKRDILCGNSEYQPNK